MEKIQYVGEHLLPGQIGHLLIILGFVTSLLTVVAYYFATEKRNTPDAINWLNIGRAAFALHGASVLGIIASMFYVMLSQHYEYNYAFQHVSDDLPFKYIFSAFWEGQEGSFLLWMFWHVVLGGILIFTAKKWEAPVLSMVSLVQLFIGSMILGLYFGAEELKIGSNPLVLLRDVLDAPVFQNPNYVSMIEGSGLNPLLQNYWMTIHPPTLFLGFASTTIPFAFAMAGLWIRDHKGWLKPVLPWALFSGGILGLGILMGGAWAYEALSFGGYWAWDPVENMSLVPWLVLVAGIHTALVAKSTGYSIKSTYLFLSIAFLLIVYSTFLTRSGILGDTSVHAFTEMGLEWQLVIFLGFFTLLGFALYFARVSGIPAPKKEESTYSREFWMFIGSLILLFSAVLISFTTSIPVYNKIFAALDPLISSIDMSNWSRTAPKDPVEHYNRFQMWIAMLLGLLSGFALWLRYRTTTDKHIKKVSIRLGIHAITAVLLTVGANLLMDIPAWQYQVLMWTSCFAILANVDNVVTVMKGNLRLAGAALGHVGFALMMIGTLASGLNKRFISKDSFMRTNPNVIEGFSEEDANNNVLLYKNLPTQMGEYVVTYTEDTTYNYYRYFNINYKRYNDKQELQEEFNLVPNIVYSKRNPNKIEAANPSTKHYLHRDVFTHISALPRSETEPEFAKAQEDSLKYIEYEVEQGDTITLKNYWVIFERLNRQPKNKAYQPTPNDITIGGNFKVINKKDGSQSQATPIYLVRGDEQLGVPDHLMVQGLKFRFSKRFPAVIAAQENNLVTQAIGLKQGENTTVGNFEIRLRSFNREVQNQNYKAQQGDIVVGAFLEVANKKTNQKLLAEPVYFIRNNAQYSVPEELRAMGLRFRFSGLDPATGTATIDVSTGLPPKEKVVVEIAENVLRDDYIVMEAIVFPGINLFWLGSLFLVIGFFVAMVQRQRENRSI